MIAEVLGWLIGALIPTLLLWGLAVLEGHTPHRTAWHRIKYGCWLDDWRGRLCLRCGVPLRGYPEDREVRAARLLEAYGEPYDLDLHRVTDGRGHAGPGDTAKIDS